MAKYQLKVYGWELKASAQSITEQQVQDIQEYQEEISKIDFKIDVEKLKKDVEKETKKFF